MPPLAKHQSTRVTKLLLIGDSGSAKTGSLASLAKAGYNLRILDFDNGLDVLVSLLKDDPDAMSRVIFETCTDKLKGIGANVVPDGPPKAFSKALNLMTHWKVGKEGDPDYYDLGKVSSWGPQDVLVIDSLTFMGNAAMRFVLAANMRAPGTKRIQDFGEAMGKIEDVLALLYSDEINCNVIITSHIKYTSDESGDENKKGYPNALGSKLSPVIGRYFNSILLTETIGTGASAKRVINTASKGIIECKHPCPLNMPPKFDVSVGLAEFFKRVQANSSGNAA